MTRPLKIRFHTLGCKLNYAESSALARRFEAAGYVRAPSDGEADLLVVNTCSVTADADKKGRNLIRRLHRAAPGAAIAVTGCFAQLKPEQILEIEGVALVLGNSRKGELFDRADALMRGKEGVGGAAPGIVLTDDFRACFGPVGGGGEPDAAARIGRSKSGSVPIFPAYSSGDRTRAFLKVQDGCDYLCTYCTVPYARGASRNISIADAVAQAREIAAAGQREIVLTGINTGDFGRTTGESFPDLLRALDEVEGIDRYRISSVEPNLLTDDVIALTANSKRFQPHFHIPLQSGSDAVLRRMRRRYTTRVFADRVSAVRRAVPDAFLGIDVIVGFPGETDADFETTHAFLEELEPAFLHVFPYSVRPDTPAAGMDGRVPPAVSADRARRLGELSGRLHRRFCERFLGREAVALFESTVRGGRMSGFTEHYVRVNTPHDASRVNTLCRVRLDAFDDAGEIRATILEPV